MKMYGKEEVKLHAFLTLALDGGKCSVSCSGNFIPMESTSGINWKSSKHKYIYDYIQVFKSSVIKKFNQIKQFIQGTKHQ